MEIKSIPTFIEILIVSAVAAMALGDYLGYKLGRKRLATGLLAAALLSIIAYAIYAALVLT
jgi:uncharacterized protein (DUF3084 family)